jgi:PHD/YefM family antitoxin component YafN of YafNO toxin-antitoxin module
MKTTSVSRLRADTTRLVEELRAGADEPVLVLQGSSLVAYLVSPRQWDALQAEIKRLNAQNRELYEDLLQAAEDQPSGKVYDSVEDLVADLNRDDAAV